MNNDYPYDFNWDFAWENGDIDALQEIEQRWMDDALRELNGDYDDYDYDEY